MLLKRARLNEGESESNLYVAARQAILAAGLSGRA